MTVHPIKGQLANSYVIDLGSELLVVDVPVGGAGAVIGFIEQSLQRPVTDVTWVLATHSDPDHSGGTRVLAAEAKATLARPARQRRGPVGALLASATRTTTGMQEMLRPRAWRMYGDPNRQQRVRQRLQERAPLRGGRVAVEQTLRDGTVLPGGWQVLATPGHSADSVCYHHPESGALITGDTLLGSASRGVVPPAIYDDWLALQRSLAVLRALSPRTIYPGHGSVVELG